MSVIEKIIREIDLLPADQKRKALQEIREKFFKSNNEFVVDENYDFWLNDADDEYENEL